MGAARAAIPSGLSIREVDAIAERVADVVLERMKDAGKREKKLLNVKEAAAYMGVTEPAMRNLIATEQVPAKAVRRFGRRVFIEKVLFDQWLEAH